MLIRRRKFRSSKLLKRRRKRLIWQAVFIALVVVFGIAGLAYSSHLEKINIKSVYINGNSTIVKEELVSFVEEKISRNYLLVLSKSNILIYPRRNIETTLFDSFKKIKEIDIDFKNLQAITLNIIEREPYALWCSEVERVLLAEQEEREEAKVASDSPKEETKEEESEECYFIDDSGIIFTKAPDFSGNVFFKYYGALLPEYKDILGARFLSGEKFKEIVFLLESMKDIGIQPISFKIEKENDFEILLEDGGKILFNRKQDILYILSNIQSVFESEEFNENERTNLDYADFRFGNKVYFKFR